MAERTEYRHFLQIQTRWNDNDVYGHVNNVQYYSYFDTVINSYLIRAGLLDFMGGSLIGVCAESHCRYQSSFSFPDVVDAGLRVEHLGRSSVRYGIGLFAQLSGQTAAEGWFVHVFVDRLTRKPTIMDAALREGLQALWMEPRL